VPVSAQGADKKGEEIEFRVTRFDPADRESPTFRVGTAEGQVEVEVPLTYIAGPFKAPLRDERFLDFWRGNGDKPEISLPIRPSEHKDLLLFFVPADKSFKVLKVSTPLTRIRGGDRYLVNATDGELAIKLGDKKPLRVAPGKAGLVRGPGGSKLVTLPVLISRKDGEEWKLASTETWYLDPRFRKYLFAYVSPRSRQLSFHVVSERL
jgi:hypothetical protein